MSYIHLFLLAFLVISDWFSESYLYWPTSILSETKSHFLTHPAPTGHVALNVHWSECSTAHWAQYRPDHGQTHSALSLSARTGFAPPGVPSTRCKGWSEELWNFNNCVAMAIMTMALGIWEEVQCCWETDIDKLFHIASGDWLAKGSTLGLIKVLEVLRTTKRSLMSLLR